MEKKLKIVLDRLNVDEFKKTGKIIFESKEKGGVIHVSIFHIK